MLTTLGNVVFDSPILWHVTMFVIVLAYAVLTAFCVYATAKRNKSTAMFGTLGLASTEFVLAVATLLTAWCTWFILLFVGISTENWQAPWTPITWIICVYIACRSIIKVAKIWSRSASD